MSSEEHNIELIEKQIRGTLSAEEEVLFAKKISEDLEFKKQFQFEKQLFETLNEEEWSFIKQVDTKEVREYLELFKSDEIDTLRKTLKEVSAKNKIKVLPTKRKLSIRMISYISAAILVIFISIYSFFHLSPSPEDITAQYLDFSDIPSLIIRSGEETSLSKGQQLFEGEHYAEAITIFMEGIADNKQRSGTIYLYLGLSQLKLNQFKNAEKTFEELINSNLIDAPKGYWYKAMTHYSAGDEASAKLVLERIRKEKLFNYQKASEILDKY